MQDEAESTSMACLPQNSQKTEQGKRKLPALAVKEQSFDPSEREESEGLHIFTIKFLEEQRGRIN